MTRMPHIKIRPTFDWRKVAWRPSEDSRPELCSYCQGNIDEDDIHPLKLWRDEDSTAAHFCDICIEAMVGAAE